MAQAQLTCGYEDPTQTTKVLGGIKDLKDKGPSPRTCPSSKLDGDNYTPSPLALGARKLLATLYGCGAVRLPFLDRGVDPLKGMVEPGPRTKNYWPRKFLKDHHAIVTHHPFFKDLLVPKDVCGLAKSCAKAVVGDPTSCSELRCFYYQNPPLYHYGGQSLYHVYPYKRGKAPRSSGFDCSTSLKLSMQAAGLRFRPYASDLPLTTTALDLGIERDPVWSPELEARLSKQTRSNSMTSSCFFRTSITDDLKPGDIVNIRGEHVVMINTVARDPFNIQAILQSYELADPFSAYQMKAALASEKDRVAKQYCSVLDQPERKRQFKFTLLQSNGSPGDSDLGYQNTRGMAVNTLIHDRLVLKAKAICVAEFWKKWGGGESEYVKQLEQQTANGKVQVARHSGSPGCIEPPAPQRFDPFACTNGCNFDVSYSNYAAEAK